MSVSASAWVHKVHELDISKRNNEKLNEEINKLKLSNKWLLAILVINVILDITLLGVKFWVK